MTLSEPPRSTLRGVGVKLGDYQFERAAAWEEKKGLALVGSASSGRRRRRRALRGDELFSEIARWAFATGANLVVEATTSPPHSPSGRRSRSASTRGDLGARARLVHDSAVLRARGLRLPEESARSRRERRARGGTALASWIECKRVTFSTGSRRVHRRAEDRSASRPRLEGRRSASRESTRAPRCRRRQLPDPLRSATA